MLTATRTRPTAGASAHARHIVRLTGRTVLQGWAAPATATAETPRDEPQEFALQVADLTGTDPQLWLTTDLDSAETHRRRVAQAADAIIRTRPQPRETEPGDDFAEVEAEIAAEAEADASRAAVVIRSDARSRLRELALAEYTAVELAAFGDDPLDAWTRHEREQVKTWSPWRGGPRWSETRRALSGPAPVRD
ncbi:hypothetical protein ACIBCA_36430 [Kitasatospora sp. NPDC051170]|uniref:hypothetical protein n=1 Tax=Kitasatospora sp. NPDC051170 TaxID=3364056 RepID=UPI00378B3160